MSNPDTSALKQGYSVSNLHSDLGEHAAEGIKAGVASELCSILVDGVIAAFDDFPVLQAIADNRFGRSILSILIPYGMALLTVVAPQTIPGGSAEALRKTCLYAIQGHATFAIQPIVGRLRGTIRRVLDAAKEQGIVNNE